MKMIKGSLKWWPPGGKQKVVIINESGLYRLVLSSKLPSAKQFKRWVTSEVIPAIRKHDGYLTPQKIEEVLADPDTIIKLATQLKEERAERMRLAAKVEEDHPKVLFAESVSSSPTSIHVGSLAKLLVQNGVDIGQNRLFSWMRDNGYLIKSGKQKNEPTQKSMELGLFEVNEQIYNQSGMELISRTTMVTGKGQQYFINLFLNTK